MESMTAMTRVMNRIVVRYYRVYLAINPIIFKVMFPYVTFLLQLIYLALFIVSGVSCGDEKLYTRCSRCEKGNITSSNGWCNGNCYFDEVNGICRDKGNSM